MPKLIVYVKADTWRRIESSANGEDAASLARRISVQAIEDFLRSEGAVGESAVSSSAAENISELERAPSDSPDLHFRPDFGKKL